MLFLRAFWSSTLFGSKSITSTHPARSCASTSCTSAASTHSFSSCANRSASSVAPSFSSVCFALASSYTSCSDNLIHAFLTISRSKRSRVCDRSNTQSCAISFLFSACMRARKTGPKHRCCHTQIRRRGSSSSTKSYSLSSSSGTTIIFLLVSSLVYFLQNSCCARFSRIKASHSHTWFASHWLLTLNAARPRSTCLIATVSNGLRAACAATFSGPIHALRAAASRPFWASNRSLCSVSTVFVRCNSYVCAAPPTPTVSQSAISCSA